MFVNQFTRCQDFRFWLSIQLKSAFPVDRTEMQWRMCDSYAPIFYGFQCQDAPRTISPLASQYRKKGWGTLVENVCRVLLVEDEYGIRKGISRLIDWTANGFAIVGEVGNGKEAFEKIESLHPHIIVTDILMPEMNGVELTKAVWMHYPAIQVVVLSGYSDYEYVRAAFQYGAVDYILKPMLNPRAFLALLQKAAARIPGLELQKSSLPSKGRMLESFLSSSAAQVRDEEFLQQFPGPSYLIMGMDVSYVFEKPQDMERYESLLREAAGKHMSGFRYSCAVLWNKIIFILVNLEPGRYEEAVAAAEQTAEQVAAYCGDAFFVCSQRADSHAELKQIYRQKFSPLLRRRFYCKEKHFLRSENSESPANPAALEKDLFAGLLRQGRLKEAAAQLKETVQDAVQSHSVEELELRSLVQNAVYQILDACEDAGVSADDLADLKRRSIVQISSVRFAEELAAAVNNISEMISSHAFPRGNGPIDEILRYICRHYSERLTLTDLAQKFNFNYYYLSTYFSTKYEENFSGYLNSVRIEKAKKLLLKKRISVAEVGSMVGYSDNSYFARVFKKGTGITPSEYRQKEPRDGEIT